MRNARGFYLEILAEIRMICCVLDRICQGRMINDRKRRAKNDPIAGSLNAGFLTAGYSSVGISAGGAV